MVLSHISCFQPREKLTAHSFLCENTSQALKLFCLFFSEINSSSSNLLANLSEPLSFSLPSVRAEQSVLSSERRTGRIGRPPPCFLRAILPCPLQFSVHHYHPVNSIYMWLLDCPLLCLLKAVPTLYYKQPTFLSNDKAWTSSGWFLATSQG